MYEKIVLASRNAAPGADSFGLWLEGPDGLVVVVALGMPVMGWLKMGLLLLLGA